MEALIIAYTATTIISAKIKIFYDVLNLNTKMMMEKWVACVDDIKRTWIIYQLKKHIHVQMATVWFRARNYKIYFLWLEALMQL